MFKIRKYLFTFTLVTLIALVLASSAHAFDGRSGDVVVVGANEVINDDLYVTAREFVLDGTVNGDLIVMGQTININGVVEGDILAAGQTIVVHGSVSGALRSAGAVLLVAENASIGGDIIAAGSSLEIQGGGRVGQDLVFAGGQMLLAGNISRNVQASTGAFELRGTVGGNLQANVGESGAGYAGPPPSLFMPQSSVPVPTVDPGLTIDPAARIEGDLAYTQTRELAIPAGVVVGSITRNEPVAGTAARPETTSERIVSWGLDLLRSSITLILIGFVLLWLFPFFMQGLSLKLQSAFLPSLGWGILAYLGFFILVLAILVAVILGGLLFGVLTLGGLAGTIVWLGILALLALVLGFVLVTSFVAKIAFGQTLGRWLLARSNPPLAGHRFWPMVIGVIITVVAIALFSFPLLPGFLGGLLNFVIVLVGLGALWLWGRDRLAGRTLTQ